MTEPKISFEQRDSRMGEQGFLLVGVIVMAALILIALSIAAPIVAKDLKREKELEAKHRGEQYVRAIRMYYLKNNNSYPASVKALESTNNVRYLRQHYLDPFTGKDDWKLIGLGQAKTTVKGFFGQPLSGLNTSAGGGLGSAASLQSGGVPTTGGTAGSTTGGTTGAGTTGSGSDQSGSTSTSAFGSPSGSGSSGFGSSSFGQSGSSGSGSNSAFGSGTTGPFVGVGLPKEGASIITLNEQTDYSTWEFIYDPRIEQLYAKSSIFGGGIASSSGGLGSASSLSSTPGSSSNSSAFGSSSFGSSSNSGSTTNGTNNGGTTTTPTSPTTPQQ